MRKAVCSSSLSRGAITGENLGGSFRSRATHLTAPSSGTSPVRLAPAAPNSDVMTAMPATEPRAAAPALPMMVAAPAAIRGAARPPVTPEKKAESTVQVGVRMWPAGLFSHQLATAFHRDTLRNTLLVEHLLCAREHLPADLRPLHSQPDILRHSGLQSPTCHHLSSSWPYRSLSRLPRSPGLSGDSASISSGFLSSSWTPRPF